MTGVNLRGGPVPDRADDLHEFVGHVVSRRDPQRTANGWLSHKTRTRRGDQPSGPRCTEQRRPIAQVAEQLRKSAAQVGAGARGFQPQRPIFGSYPYPPNFPFKNVHEYIIIAAEPPSKKSTGKTVLPYNEIMRVPERAR